jgi:hypothetical protein
MSGEKFQTPIARFQDTPMVGSGLQFGVWDLGIEV